ncbi:aldolase [Paenibacillus sp. FSL H8-0034]|uniref:aldolase n=1 Tax=Paenibacillus sp. FSL H8-0034 TaxID=2954671 RepID=UPI0030F4F947
MAVTLNKVVYRAFGLSMISEIMLPELPLIHIQDNQIDVVIKRADLTPLWNQLAKPNETYVVRENSFMFRVPDTAIFCIQDGAEITVSAAYGADEAKIRLYLLGTCIGALLMQKRILPLHGSAIVIDGKAYALVGDSGAGKSTLASVFVSRGHQLISDDLIAVNFSHDRIPVVMPAYPQQKLWQESLTEFGMEASQFPSIFDRETKYLVPVPGPFITEPLPLAGVIELGKEEGEQVMMKSVQGLERLHTLYRQTFRSFLLAKFDLLEWHFGMTAAISNQIDFYQIHRPHSGFTAPQMASLILKTVQGDE